MSPKHVGVRSSYMDNKAYDTCPTGHIHVVTVCENIKHCTASIILSLCPKVTLSQTLFDTPRYILSYIVISQIYSKQSYATFRDNYSEILICKVKKCHNL